MACRTTKFGDGFMWICGPAMKNAPVCRECGHLAENLCDYPVGKGKTCDASICAEHSGVAGPDLHYCPPHMKMWNEYVSERGLESINFGGQPNGQ